MENTTAQITKKYRNQVRLSLAKFSEALGCSRGAVNQWEHGIVKPNRYRLADFARRTDWVGDWARECLEIVAPEWMREENK